MKGERKTPTTDISNAQLNEVIELGFEQVKKNMG